jgi:hypothetical protein
MSIAALIHARSERRRAQALSRAIQALPAETRAAMLAAAREQTLIAGGYANRRGDVCPMLAAHRRGARTDVGHFPLAWDRFTGATRPRPASVRELEILCALLEESLGPSPTPVLAAAAAPVSPATPVR